ncbi:MAG: alpha/beta fold hydrolase, partial [Sciscionella sp.]
AQMWRDIAGPGDLALSLPGFGDTPLQGVPSFPALVEFVASQLTEPADLVGVSLGSMVAQHTALLRPDKVRSLVIACGGIASDPERSHQRAKDTRDTGMRGVLDSTLQRWFTAEALANEDHPGVAYTRHRLLTDDPEVFAAYWDAMAAHDLRESIRDVKVATTVLAAAGDQAVSVAVIRGVADLIDGAAFEVIEGPHILPLENRAGFMDAIQRHLGRVGP